MASFSSLLRSALAFPAADSFALHSGVNTRPFSALLTFSRISGVLFRSAVTAPTMALCSAEIVFPLCVSLALCLLYSLAFLPLLFSDILAFVSSVCFLPAKEMQYFSRSSSGMRFCASDILRRCSSVGCHPRAEPPTSSVLYPCFPSAQFACFIWCVSLSKSGPSDGTSSSTENSKFSSPYLFHAF